MTLQSLTLPLRDGASIRGDLRLPEGGSTPRSAVLVLHGFKGFRRWGFFPHLADELARDGHAVISCDFSLNGVGGDGESFDRPEDFERNTFSREVRETRFLLDEIRHGGLLPGSPERVGLLGHSRGGAVAVLATRDAALQLPPLPDEGAEAADVPVRTDRPHAPDALVTWAAVARFGRWSPEQVADWRREGRSWVLNSRTGQRLPLGLGLLEDVERHGERLDAVQAAREMAGLPAPPPWLIVHGAHDPTVPVGDARSLAEAHPAAELLVLPGSGHTFEARHPLTELPEGLGRAMAATREHLRRVLLDG